MHLLPWSASNQHAVPELAAFEVVNDDEVESTEKSLSLPLAPGFSFTHRQV